MPLDRRSIRLKQAQDRQGEQAALEFEGQRIFVGERGGSAAAWRDGKPRTERLMSALFYTFNPLPSEPRSGVRAGASVIMTVGVNVSVRQFLCRRVPHVQHLDIEVQVLARHRVVGVQDHALRVHRHHP
jgi:hypothetical protein